MGFFEGVCKNPQLDRAETLRQTEAHQKAMRKRQVWVESKFGEVKQWHGLYRFRLRRLWRVNIEALLIASVQNIKQLLKPRRPSQKPLALYMASCFDTVNVSLYNGDCLCWSDMRVFQQVNKS